MSKIVLRGKKVNENKWVYGSLIDWGDGDFSIANPSTITGANIFHIVPSTVGQFTGVKDKKEKNIYVGDLHLTEAEVDGKMKKNYLPVLFDNGAYWLDESFKKDGTHLTLLCQYNDEPLNIMGNIHDNPELLK